MPRGSGITFIFTLDAKLFGFFPTLSNKNNFYHGTQTDITTPGQEWSWELWQTQKLRHQKFLLEHKYNLLQSKEVI